MMRFFPSLAAMLVLIVPVSLRAQIKPQQPAQPQTRPAVTAPVERSTPPQSTAATAQRQNPAPIRVRTDLVLVPATVKDHNGELVSDLQRDDFRILCDGVQQQVLQFSADPVPLSAVVIVDNDLSEKEAAQVQKSLRAVAAGFGQNDEVALVTYDEFPHTVSNFSFNNDTLFTQLKRLELDSHSQTVLADPTTAGPMINGQPLPNGQGVPLHGSGRYANNNDIDDALYAGAQMLKSRGRERRKIIFLITDGADSRHDQHSVDETLHALLAADVSVYAISVSHSVPLGKSLLQHGESKVDKYARQTGGDTFFASKDADLGRLYPEVTEQARNQYTLAFSPKDLNKTRDYHTIEVRVERPDLNIFTRQGFYQSAVAAPR
ncbi:MAG: VWA domain-containing protein [Candidatus Acidiferrales bacterium]